MRKGQIVKAFNPKTKYLTHDKEYEIEWISAGGYIAVKNDDGKVKPYSTQNFYKQVTKPTVVEGKYYWVQCFKESEFEPAKARDRYDNGEMYFCFTNGSVKECKYVEDYKELYFINN